MSAEYFEAPASSLAFCEGQVDAREHKRHGCLFRLRGRNKLSYTLVNYPFIGAAELACDDILAEGGKVSFLNYTTPAPPWSTKGPTEWLRRAGSELGATKSAKTRSTIRRAGSGCSIRPPSKDEAFQIFENWIAWAATRHFMVFKGHYRRWLEIHFEGHYDTQLIMVEKDNKRGLFGWEDFGDWSQVTIAKPEPGMNSKALWVTGLNTIGDRDTLCGSTADKLKNDIGLVGVPSWTSTQRRYVDAKT